MHIGGWLTARVPARLKRRLGPGILLAVIVLCGAQIVRGALAPPVTSPVEADRRKAERVAVSRVGGPDVRDPLPLPGDQVGGNGVVEPAERETRLAAPVSGVVARVLVKEGEHVEAGALLVQLDDRVERAALQVAEAEMLAERATRTRTQRGLRAEERDAILAEAQGARARAELSAGIAARLEGLSRRGAATPDELERAQKQARADEAALRAAEARQRAADVGSRGEDLTIQQARAMAAEGRVAQARAALERLSMRAPIAGEILQIKVREGELYSVQMGDPLLIMGDTRRLRVRMDVDERDIARVRLGAPSYVRADAFGARRFEGKVAEIGRRFGRKNIRTDDPVERNDTKILEVVIDLVENQPLIPGQRVTSFVSAAP